jgi:hypothetical protein
MEKFVWFNPYLPQTLRSATILLYISAAFDIILHTANISLIGLAIAAGYVLGGFGISNLRWWGIFVGVISVGFTTAYVTFLALKEGASIFDVLGFFFSTEQMIGTLFTIAIIALMVHPMSIQYAKRNFTKRIP